MPSIRVLASAISLPGLLAFSAVTAASAAETPAPPPSTPASADDIRQLREAVDAVLKQNASLVKQNEELLGRVDALEATASEEDTGHGLPKLNISGFAHLNHEIGRVKTDDGSDRQNFFDFAGADLMMTAALAKNISFLGELVFEISEENQEVVTDVDRMFVKFDLGHGFNLQTGRFYTPLGYWNQNYRHGAEWMQTTIERPNSLRFEEAGGIIPLRSIGVQAESYHDFPAFSTDLIVGVGNGRGAHFDPPQSRGDGNYGKSVVATLAVKPHAAPGLALGVSAYYDTIPADPVGPPVHGAQREIILNGYLAYRHNSIEALGEYFYVRHSPQDHLIANTETAVSSAYYLQFGYRFGDFTPYARYDVESISDEDTYFADTDNTIKGNLGVRWDISTWVALKMQYEYQHIRAGDGSREIENTLLSQICWAF